MDLIALIAAVGGCVTGLAGLVAAVVTYRRAGAAESEAEAAVIQANAAADKVDLEALTETVKALQIENERLRGRLDAFRVELLQEQAQNRDLRAENALLVGRIKCLERELEALKARVNAEA
jgi:predicted RNase H-like nuclease (RuvC/YqgF family)